MAMAAMLFGALLVPVSSAEASDARVPPMRVRIDQPTEKGKILDSSRTTVWTGGFAKDCPPEFLRFKFDPITGRLSMRSCG